MYGVADPATRAAVRVYVKLLRARTSVVARVEKGLAARGLTLTQLGVLEALLHLGPMTHGELGRKVLTSLANLTNVLDQLAARDLVARERGEADRRLVRIALTPSGRTLIEQVFPAHAADIAAAMSGLDAAERAVLDRLLRKLGQAAQEGLAEVVVPPHLAERSFDVERPSSKEDQR